MDKILDTLVKLYDDTRDLEIPMGVAVLSKIDEILVIIDKEKEFHELLDEVEGEV